MTINLNFKHINYNKNVKELEYKVKSWISDLTFYKIEIEFLNKIINTYPFKSNTRNLFENIQIYTQNLDDFKSKGFLFLKRLTTIKQQITKTSKEDIQKKHSQFIEEFHKLEYEILIFLETYKNLKNSIYNYFYAQLSN